MPSFSMITFQDPQSPMMEQLIIFYDHIMLILIMITLMVLYIMTMLFINKLTNRFLLEGQMIELIWTIIPAIMLIFIAMPSIKTLYLLEESSKPAISIKAIGNQWFWSYEYSDFKKIEFDSYMKPTSELQKNENRLLETDNRVVVPNNTKSRIITTSSDVIHSWTVPSLGIKIDSTPGRINQMNMMISRPGIVFGQCSEICGVNHSFMPIMIESISMKMFINWLKNFYIK